MTTRPSLPPLARPGRWSVVALIVLTIAAYAVGRSRHDLVDFTVYRTAAVRAVAAEPLYRAEDGHYQFKYWPAFALAMAPFGLLPSEVGKAIWFGLSVALLALFLRRSIAAMPERRRPARTLVWVTLLLIGKFVVLELVNGQTNILLGMLIVLALVDVTRGRETSAGWLVGAAIFVKPYAMVMLPWLAVTQRMRALAVTATIVAVGLAAPALVYGWQGNLDLLRGWTHTVIGTTPENLLFPENISFATLSAKWFGPGPLASWLAVGLTGGVLLVAGIIWLWRRRVPAPDYLEVSLLLLLVPLVSPQGWDYVLLIAAPAVVLFVDRWPELPVGWRIAIAASFACTSFAIYDLWGRSAYRWMMSAGVESVAAIVLVVSLAALRRRGLA